MFSVQHPDLSSALIAPRGALGADFRCSSSRIEISTSRNRGRKRMRTGEGPARAETLPVVPASDDGLTSADRKAVEDFVLGMNFGTGSQHQSQGAGQENSDLSRLDQSCILSGRARELVQLAIRMLVCGQKGQYKGLSILQSSPSHSLTSLAPAVFHIPYLKARIRRRRTFERSLMRATDCVRPRKASPDNSHVFGTDDRCRVAKSEAGRRVFERVSTGICDW